MTIPKAILFSVALITSSAVFAGAGAPVKHNHNGRTHTHPLPAEGANHNHTKSGSRHTPRQPGNSGWTLLSSSKGIGNFVTNYYGKSGSLTIQKNHATIIGKVNDSLIKTVELYKWSVPISTCHNQIGKMLWYKVDGKYVGSTDYVSGAGSVASSIADAICGVALRK